MSQQNQGPHSSSPADLPMKRKRGRPRKEESMVQTENTPVMPGSDSVRKNKQSVGASNAAADNMVGQVVSGVIEGSFDAGYLLNVKVGGTDTHLRGVVFLPGQFTPITTANDVAPHAKMYTRKEIPIPCLNPQTQLRGSVPPSEKSDKQHVELNNQVPKLSEQIWPSELQSRTVVADEKQFASDMIPLPNKLPVNGIGLSLGEKILPQQTLECELESQALSVVAQPEHDKLSEQDEMVERLEPSTLIEGPNTDAGAAKESDPEAAPSVDILPGTETANQEPQVQQQAASSDLLSNELVKNEGRSLNLEHNQTPVLAESQSMSFELSGIHILMEKQISQKEDVPQDMQAELANKIISGDDTSHINGRPLNDATTSCELNSQSAPMTSLSEIMFEGEAIVTEPKPAAIEPVLPRIVAPQVYSSSAATDNVDCNVNCAIPPAQSFDLFSGVKQFSSENPLSTYRNACD